MPDKKKRGRPPGSKGKPKVEPFNPSKLDQEVKEVMGDFDKDFKEKGFGITPNKGILAVDGDKFNPFPDNWFSLSKVDKLSWLTANKK